MNAGPIRTDQTPLRHAAARITGGFWHERRRVNMEVGIPQGPALLESAGNLHNLRAAAGSASGGFRGDFPFLDSDVFKWLEAASWQLGDDPALEAPVAAIIALVAAAQRPDGYLNTWVQLVPGEAPYRDLRWGHELYCAAHLIQAGLAHHRATGRTTLLEIARGWADHIEASFGPDRPIDGICGHPGIETALVELYRETAERRYLDLARYFTERRGHGLLAAAPANTTVAPGVGGAHGSDPGPAFWQDREPVREATAVEGHAVRQLYLLAGAADLAAETGDAELVGVLARLWEDMTATRMYLTGGVGSRHAHEDIGDPFELPNERAYCETCAAVASIQWSWRMALLTGETRYSDLIERTLFNGLLAGMSLDGERWLYVNPLQVRDGHHAGTADQTSRRTPWFRCACCPPNVMRLLASLPHYFASGDAEGLLLHQYATGTYEASGARVRVETGYPWRGQVRVTVEHSPAEEWTLALRVPRWCRSARIDGRSADAPDGWLRLRRAWRPGDEVVLNLPLEPVLIEADPRADAVRGCAAITYGPLVYCLEQADHPEGVDTLVLDTAEPLTAWERPDLLGGITVITAEGMRRLPPAPAWWPYHPAGEASTARKPVELTAIPYFAWANRAEGSMRVWIPSS